MKELRVKELHASVDSGECKKTVWVKVVHVEGIRVCVNEKVLCSRAVGGRAGCEKCVMRKRCECMRVKEMYVEEVFVKGP